MSAAARTPEDLEMLLEDAFVLRDAHALAALFDPASVLVRVADGDVRRWTMHDLAAGLWPAGATYYSGRRRIVQAADTVLVTAAAAANVMRRGRDGSWRYAICLLDATDELILGPQTGAP